MKCYCEQSLSGHGRTTIIFRCLMHWRILPVSLESVAPVLKQAIRWQTLYSSSNDEHSLRSSARSTRLPLSKLLFNVSSALKSSRMSFTSRSSRRAEKKVKNQCIWRQHERAVLSIFEICCRIALLVISIIRFKRQKNTTSWQSSYAHRRGTGMFDWSFSSTNLLPDRRNPSDSSRKIVDNQHKWTDCVWESESCTPVAMFRLSNEQMASWNLCAFEIYVRSHWIRRSFGSEDFSSRLWLHLDREWNVAKEKHEILERRETCSILTTWFLWFVWSHCCRLSRTFSSSLAHCWRCFSSIVDRWRPTYFFQELVLLVEISWDSSRSNSLLRTFSMNFTADSHCCLSGTLRSCKACIWMTL